jgi:capsular polysaccharide biosynthesis protein
MDKPVRRAVRNHNLTEALGIENENECVKMVTKMISAFKEEKSSGIFYVSVTADDPKVAHAVMTAIEAEFPEVIKELYGFKHDTDRGEFVSVVNEIGDEENVKTVTTSVAKTAVVCALVVFVVVYTVYLVLSLLDNSISGENTIKENFKQPVLGNIPT